MDKNWKQYKFKDITTKIGSGSTPRGGDSAYFREGISLIRSQNILDFKFSIDGLAHINEEQAYELRSVTLEENDVLVNITGDSVARVCQVPQEILPARVNQHVAIVRANTKLADSKFLKYYLLHPATKSYLLSLSSSGATRKALTKVMLEEIEINLPIKSEQTAIASILSSLDDKIELNLQTNKTLEEMANALYKHWFVDFGPFQGGKFVESELGMIPERWGIKLISEICEINTKTVKPFENSDEEYYHYSLPSFDSVNIALKELGSTIASNKTLINEPTILVSKLNPRIRRVWTVIPEKGKISISSTEFMNYVPKQIYRWGYLNCFFRTDFFFEELLKQATGTSNSHQRAQPKETLQIKIIGPDKNDSIKFNELVSPLFELIETNFSEIVSLKQTRDYLLPKLISGEIRVKDAEKKIKSLV